MSAAKIKEYRMSKALLFLFLACQSASVLICLLTSYLFHATDKLKQYLR